MRWVLGWWRFSSRSSYELCYGGEKRGWGRLCRRGGSLTGLPCVVRWTGSCGVFADERMQIDVAAFLHWAMGKGWVCRDFADGGESVGLKRKRPGAVRRRGVWREGVSLTDQASWVPLRMMSRKLWGSRAAPPMRAPSMSGQAMSSAALLGLTEPPYWMRILAAVSWP